MRVLMYFFFFSLCIGCSSNQADRSTATKAVADSQSVGAKTEDSDDRVICRRVTVTGSNMGKRVCKTKREIKEESELAQEQNRQAIGNNSSTPTDN